MTHTYTFDEEELNERYALVTERIAEITKEVTLPGVYGTYMHEVAGFLENVAEIHSEAETQAMQQIGQILSADAYATSFLNPAYATEQLGREPGQLLSFIYADIVAMIGPAKAGRKDLVTLWMELFVMLYGEFTAELDDPLGSLVSKELMHELKDTVYWFYHDNAEVILWDLADRVADFLKSRKSESAGTNDRSGSKETDLIDDNTVSAVHTNGHSRIAAFMNTQLIVDHREDRAIYLDKGFLLRCEEILTDIFTKEGREHGRIEGVLDLQKIFMNNQQITSGYRISLSGLFEETTTDHLNDPIPSAAAVRLTQHQCKMEQDFKEHLTENCLEHTGIQLVL